MKSKESIRSGMIGGGVGLIISFLLNYFFLPIPQNILQNAIGNGISGLFSGFSAGAMGVFAYISSKEKK